MLLLPAERTLTELRKDLDSLADELALDLSLEESAD
jgi:glycine cleavage system regulatory protein